MTLVSEIITDAYRQSNLIALGTVPSDAQNTEALRYLNRIVKSSFGNEAGGLLEPYPLGRGNIVRPSGWPWYENVPPAEWVVPTNAQLMCNLSSPSTVYLNPQPTDGARFGVNDLSLNFDTNSLTVEGNGRLIDGGTAVVLDTAGTAQVWFYRDDIGEWLTVTPLALDSTFPFPEDFDFFFIAMLALALNPMYGAEMNAQTAENLRRSKRQFQARYTNTIPMRSEIALINLPNQSAERWARQSQWGTVYDPTSIFLFGGPW